METIISWDRSTDIATVYTCDPRLWKKLDKCPDIYKYHKQDTMKGQVISKTYKCEKRFITLRMTDSRGKGRGNVANFKIQDVKRA